MTSDDGAPSTSTDVALLGLAKLALGLYVLGTGFSHVSDDDYARTVIAQQFAHAPTLDPTGTSWLPVPFWVVGAVMGVAGRSLSVSRAVAITLGTLSVAAPYAAMRTMGVQRTAALAGVAIAMALPWNAWLAVAMVPEGWTGALVAAALMAMIDARGRAWASAALLVTSLSRYEAWPACVLFAALCIVRARSSPERAVKAREVACALVAMAGPLSWMAWNALAHGSALHFLARVRAFRRATGASAIPLSAKLIGFPRVLVEQTPEVALCAALGGLALSLDGRMRRRWGWSAAGVVAIVAFLVVGDVRDGAPTHHPARALSPVWWILVGLSADAAAMAMRSLRSRIRGAAWIALAATAVAWAVSLPSRWRASPGRTDWERRDAQIAVGLAMRARGVSRAEITPCAFEHFALLAAWGRPERAKVNPPLNQPPTRDCPRVAER